MKKGSTESSTKPDRKTVERNRRIHMKGLCLKLASLVPPHHLKANSKSKLNAQSDTLSQQNQLDLAASYIKQLKERIEGLKERKEKLMGRNSDMNNNVDQASNTSGLSMNSRLPVMELRESGPSIEVMVISGLNKNFMFYELISVLEEEGAEVVSASFSTVGDKVFHSVHAQVKISRVGVETSAVRQRLQDLI